HTSCLSNCRSTCESECRVGLDSDILTVFVEWNMCMLAECSEQPGSDLQSCMWSLCGSQSLDCLNDHMVTSGSGDDGSCKETYNCLVSQIDEGFAETAACVTLSLPLETEQAFALLECVTRASGAGGVCEAEKQNEPRSDVDALALDACLAEACSEQAAACQ
ncbi:MAG: hypothetical protein QF464_08530, partial [Myxococcota bacterium]|nr:hypothetical protein [Myxococcota bacterium]